MDHVDGEVLPKRILNEDRIASGRELLPTQLAINAARIHRVAPRADNGAIPHYDGLNRVTEQYRRLGKPRPVLELGLAWLHEHRPAPERISLVHGDYRLGNLIVDPTGLRAVIDWELVHWGDPLEDLGWLSMRAWRFGGTSMVAGLGDLDEFLAAYDEESGSVTKRSTFAWWLMLATVLWGVGCMGQADRHLSGAFRSIDLVAIGRRVAEQEMETLSLLRQAGEKV